MLCLSTFFSKTSILYSVKFLFSSDFLLLDKFDRIVASMLGIATQSPTN
nr:MAG TPA: hypothetical protein [Caudoviricetes sp.]